MISMPRSPAIVQTALAGTFNPESFVPSEIGPIRNTQVLVPKIAKDNRLTALIERAVQSVPTQHELCQADARKALERLQPESVHLILTSPPYWTLKKYRLGEQQLGHIADYQEFLEQLDKVWERCFRGLVSGGRRPVKVKEPHFRVFPEFDDTSYAKRYELLLTKLVRERFYDAACLVSSDRKSGVSGGYQEPGAELSFKNFIASLLGHAIGFIKTR